MKNYDNIVPKIEQLVTKLITGVMISMIYDYLEDR